MSQAMGEHSALEQELKSAIALYKEQLEQLKKVSDEDPGNQEVIDLHKQLEEALDEARAALRLCYSQGIDSQGNGYATSASAAAGMDIGAEEDGQEAESSAAPESLAKSGRDVVENGPEVRSTARPGRNNPRMHPNNKYYREEPDFAALAKQYPELRPYLTQGSSGRSHYEYTSWEATRQLTATLLKHDFGIEWWLPEGHLVPTLTNRANYIHWIFDLLQLSKPEGMQPMHGLDIGCGANFIYCLLGAAIYGWHMVGADVTDVAMRWSRWHMRSNPHLGQLLEVRDSRKRHAEAHEADTLDEEAESWQHELDKIVARQKQRHAPADATPLGIETIAEHEAGDEQQADCRGLGSGRVDAGESHQQADSACIEEVEVPSSIEPPAAELAVVVAESGSCLTDNEAGHDGAASHMGDRVDEAPAGPAGNAAEPEPDVLEPSVGGTLVPEHTAAAHHPPDLSLAAPSSQAGSVAGHEPEEEEEEEPDQGGLLTAALRGSSECFAFSMCNPPFFNSMSEASGNPNTACGGTEMEMVYPGGELAFVMRMVDDSVRLGARVHWYTTMVGKKVTLKALRKELHARHVTAIRTTELAQGSTSRWAIAWSFEVDPNLANQPLPRAVNPALAAPLRPKRLVSFTLQGPQQDGRKLLKAMEAALSAHGAAGIAVDLGMWTLTAGLPVGDAAAGTAASSGAAAAAAAVPARVTDAVQQHAQKRQRHPAAALGTGLDASAAVLRVNMYQQQRGRFDIMASIPKTTSESEAMCFTNVMQKVQDDMTAMWT